MKENSPSERVSKLRPIIIKDYNPNWPIQYESERLRLLPCLRNALMIEHVGSTAVPNLCAKPIIDILIVVKDMVEADNLIPQLNALGYDQPIQRNSPDERRFLLRYLDGDDIEGFHLHLLSQSNKLWIKEFIERRNFLRTHPEAAVVYGKLKRKLAQKHGSQEDRLSYQYAEEKRRYLDSLIPLSDA